jgi:hypothetical protein
MSLRVVRLQLTGVLAKATKQSFEEHQRRASELQEEFVSLCRENSALLETSRTGGKRTAQQNIASIRALGKNYAETASVLEKLADELAAAAQCAGASKSRETE